MGRSIKLVIYYFGYQILCSLLISVPVTISVFTNGITAPDELAYEIGRATSSYTGVTMLLAGALMIWHLLHFKYLSFNRSSWSEVPIRTLLLSIPLLVGASTASNILVELLHLPNPSQDLFIALSRTVSGFLSIAVMAPLIEEFLFRGAIEGHLLRQGQSPRKAILLSALIFGLIHLNPVQIPFAFCLGLVFGWLYYRTGSVVPGILGHFLNNSFAAASMAFLPEEEAKKTIVESLGTTPTYLLFALSVAVTGGMLIYLNKQLPHPAPVVPEEENPFAGVE